MSGTPGGLVAPVGHVSWLFGRFYRRNLADPGRCLDEVRSYRSGTERDREMD